MTSFPSPWQQSLNADLVQRLNSPLRQPGVVNNRMASAIIERSSRLHNRLPLLAQQMQRWSTVVDLETQQTPIVYVQLHDRENRASEESKGGLDLQPSDTDREQKPLLLMPAELVHVSNSPASNITTGVVAQPDASHQAASNPLTPVRISLSKHDDLRQLSAQHPLTSNQAQALRTEAQLSSLPVVQVNAKQTPTQQDSPTVSSHSGEDSAVEERSQSNEFVSVQNHPPHPPENSSVGIHSVANTETIQPVIPAISQVTPQIQLKLDHSSPRTSLPFLGETDSNVSSPSQETNTPASSSARSNSLPIVQVTQSSPGQTASIEPANSLGSDQSQVAQSSSIQDALFAIEPARAAAPIQQDSSTVSSHSGEDSAVEERSQSNEFVSVQNHPPHPPENSSVGIHSVANTETIQPVIPAISQVTPQIQLKLDHSSPRTSLPFLGETDSNVSSPSQETNTPISSSARSNSLPIVQVSQFSLGQTASIEPANSLGSDQSQVAQSSSIQDALFVVEPARAAAPLSPPSQESIQKSQVAQSSSIQDALFVVEPARAAAPLSPPSQESIQKSQEKPTASSTVGRQMGTDSFDSQNLRSQQLAKRSPVSLMPLQELVKVPIVQVEPEPSSLQFKPLILSHLPSTRQTAINSSNTSSISEINSSTNSQKVSAHPQSLMLNNSTASQSAATSAHLNSPTARTQAPQVSSITQTASQTTAAGVNLPSQVDLDTLAEKVERKLMRKFVAESERRGKKKWH